MLEKRWFIGKDTNAGNMEGGGRRVQQRIRWLDDLIDSVDMSLHKLQETVKDMETQRAAVIGISKNQTQLSYWTSIATTEWGIL